MILLCLSRTLRRHSNYFATVVLFGVIVSGCYSLILRFDTDFSPFFMSLLWVNVHFGASKIAERAVSGVLLILLYTLVWLFVLHKPVLNMLNTQTLTYIHPQLPPLYCALTSPTRGILRWRRAFWIWQRNECSPSVPPHSQHDPFSELSSEILFHAKSPLSLSCCFPLCVPLHLSLNLHRSLSCRLSRRHSRGLSAQLPLLSPLASQRA